ncbi:toll-like receptor 4 [Argonauta hians]
MNIQQACLLWILPFQVIAVLSLNDTFYVRQNCRIYEFTNIVCRNIDLHNKHLNFEKLNGTFALYLIGTNLQTLEENMFNGIKLENLSISKNPLTMINKNAFNGQEDSLKRLTLSTTNTSVQVDFTVLQSLHNLETLEIKKFKMNENLNNFTSNNLSRLKNLSLIENKLHYFSTSAFENLVNLTRLEVRFNGLTEIPLPDKFKYLKNLQHLDLSDNYISKISAENLQENRKLEFLDLSHNSISIIDEFAFKNIENSLLNLDLALNAITREHLKHFRNMRKLRSLKLDYNKITSLAGDNHITSLGGNLFQNMNQLKTLSVKYNQLTKLHKTHLSGLNNLEKLVLNNNLLLIESSAMEALPHLETLYLENQQLNETMSMDWLENTNGWIKKLYLKGNRLNVKQLWKSIKTLAHLEVLDLSSCHLNEIPLFAFEKNTRLELLKLNDNEIETLREGTFEGLQNSLESIQLASNQLQLVDECVFNNFSWPDREFFNIDFSNNKLQCNCSLQWLQDQLKEFLKRHNDAMYQFQFWTCFNSTENIVKAELNCQSNGTNVVCEDFGMRYTTQPITMRYTTEPITMTTQMFSSESGNTQNVTDPNTTAGSLSTFNNSSSIRPTLNTTLQSTQTSTTKFTKTTPRTFERPKCTVKLQEQGNSVRIEWTVSDMFWVKDFTLNIIEILPNHTRVTTSKPLHKLTRSEIYNILDSRSILHICIVVNVKIASNVIDACDTFKPNVMATTHANSSLANILEIGLGTAIAIGLVILIVLVCLLYARRKNMEKPSRDEPNLKQQVSVTPKTKRYQRKKRNEAHNTNINVISNGQLQTNRQFEGSHQNRGFVPDEESAEIQNENLRSEHNGNFFPDLRLPLRNIQGLNGPHFNPAQRPLPSLPRDQGGLEDSKISNHPKKRLNYITVDFPGSDA